MHRRTNHDFVLLLRKTLLGKRGLEYAKAIEPEHECQL